MSSPFPADAPERPALRSRRAWVVFLVAALLALAVDLGTKWWAFYAIAPEPVEISRSLVQQAAQRDVPLGTLVPPHEPVVVVPGLLELTLVLNRGAVFGLGQGGNWFFVPFTLIAMPLLTLWVLSQTRPRDAIAHTLVGVVVGGAVGNLYDRVRFAAVRDFLHPLPDTTLPSGQPLWPYVSNVADALLIVGIAGLFVWGLWDDRRRRRTAAEPAPARGDN